MRGTITEFPGQFILESLEILVCVEDLVEKQNKWSRTSWALHAIFSPSQPTSHKSLRLYPLRSLESLKMTYKLVMRL
jgi:hypothetical protein